MTKTEPIYRGNNFGWDVSCKTEKQKEFINTILSKAYCDGQNDILYAIKEGFLKI